MTTFNDQAMFQFIGNVARGSAATIDALPNGAIGIFDEDGAVKADAITSGTFRVVQKKLDGEVLFSPWFTIGEVITKKQAAYSPDFNRVTYLGTNAAGAVTGLGSAASTIYNVKVGLKEWGSVNSSEFIKEIAYQTAASGDTTATVASGLFDSAQRAFKFNNPIPPIQVERIANVNTVAAFTGAATIYKFTKNSKVITTYTKTAAATPALTTSVATIVAGDVIHVASTNGKTFTFDAHAAGTSAGRNIVYIGETTYNVADAGTNAQNAAAIAAAINAGTQAIASAEDEHVTITYKNDLFLAPPMVIYSVDDSTFANIAVTITAGEAKPVAYIAAASVTDYATLTMDKPWQGETCYLYEGTGATTTSSCGVATLNTGDAYGLKFSAVPQPFDPVNDSANDVRFEVYPMTGTGFFATSVIPVTIQAGVSGTGSYRRIAGQEILAQWQNKGTNIEAYPRTVYKMEAKPNSSYNVTTLRLKKALNTSLIGAQPATFATIDILTDNPLLATDYGTLATVFAI